MGVILLHHYHYYHILVVYVPNIYGENWFMYVCVCLCAFEFSTLKYIFHHKSCFMRMHKQQIERQHKQFSGFHLSTTQYFFLLVSNMKAYDKSIYLVAIMENVCNVFFFVDNHLRKMRNRQKCN